jgi:hypothetical protein
VRWVSPDPILNAYLDGAPNGGVLTPRNLSLYVYASLSPARYVDPNGEAAYEVAEKIEASNEYKSWRHQLELMADAEARYGPDPNFPPGAAAFNMMLADQLLSGLKQGTKWAQATTATGWKRTELIWEDVRGFFENMLGLASLGSSVAPKPSSIALDTNALVDAIEGDGAALRAVGNRDIVVPPQAAKEFMKGPKALRDAFGTAGAREIQAQKLRSFMQSTGARMGPHSTPGASGVFRFLGTKSKDASVLGSSLLEGEGAIPVLTRDTDMMCKVPFMTEGF